MDPSETGGAQAAGKPRIVSGEALGALEESIQRTIALRAYDVYESRGRAHGDDLRDWFAAENELIKPSNVQVADSGGAIKLSASVPGFSASDLQIGVSRRRAIIWGEHARGGSSGANPPMLGEIDLPTEVDPSKTSATMSGDVVQVQMEKA